MIMTKRRERAIGHGMRLALSFSFFVREGSKIVFAALEKENAKWMIGLQEVRSKRNWNAREYRMQKWLQRVVG